MFNGREGGQRMGGERMGGERGGERGVGRRPVGWEGVERVLIGRVRNSVFGGMSCVLYLKSHYSPYQRLIEVWVLYPMSISNVYVLCPMSSSYVLCPTSYIYVLCFISCVPLLTVSTLR